MARLVVWVLSLSCLVVAQEGTGEPQVPEPFAPFESLAGAWNGQAVAKANRLKGWAEKHSWAWKFVKGKPAGMTLELKGDKTLAKGQLTFDEAEKVYRLAGEDPEGKPVAFVGKLDNAGKALVLDRVGETAEGKERITIRPNSNNIRYLFLLDRKEAGAPQYKNVIEVGLTKENEAFAAGGADGADQPKCIVTGGAAAMTVSFEGKTFPICCTGCRDEFNENPAKYVKKALLRMQAGDKPAVTAASDVARPAADTAADSPKPAAKKEMAKSKPGRPSSRTGDEAAAKPEPAAKKPASKAASLLDQAQAFEKSGKSSAAVTYYKRIVKEYPGTPQAKTAAEKIKELGGKAL